MSTHDYRSPAEIEREIEQERASLTGTLDELQNRFSFDNMTSEVGHYVRNQSGEIVSAVSRAVRENPMAIALTGVGIAWMILGNRRGDTGNGNEKRRGASGYGHDEDDWDDYGSSTVGRTSHAYRAGTADRYAGGSYDEGTGGRGFPGTLRDTDPDWVRGYADVLGTPDDMGPSYDDDTDGTASSAAGRMKEGFARAGERMKDAAHDAGHDVEGRIESARRRLSEMRERLAHGTEDLTEDGRRRVVAAREKAIEARHQLARQWNRGSRAASGMYDRQPLAAGALAFAAGAAIAAALPRTDMEDDYLGGYSDDLMHEAERIYEEERARLGRVVSATADEAKDVMNEKVEEVKKGAEAVQDEARDAAERIATRAREEAAKEHSGKTGT